MISSSRMQSIAGCITFPITNGLASIKIWLNEILTPRTLMYLHPDLQDDASPKLHNHQRLDEYIVTLSSGEPIYILAANAMDAAFSALELSEDRHTKLVDVRLTDEW